MDIGHSPDVNESIKVESRVRVRIPKQMSDRDRVKEELSPPPSAKLENKERHEQDDESLIDGEAMSKAIARVREFLRGFDNRVEVSLDKGAGVMVARILNRETGALIRQIPPQELLDVASRIHEVVGLLFDNKV